METDAANGNQQVADKEAALKTCEANVAGLRKKLNEYLAKAVSEQCKIDKCKVDSVAIDADASFVYVQLTPAMQDKPGAVADAAMNAIGQIIERTLYRSALTWNSARFTVYALYNNKSIPEFQLTFLRPSVDYIDFKTIDDGRFDNTKLLGLAQTTWLARAVNEIQGIPMPPPVMQPAMTIGGYPKMKYTTSLMIGGYVRADGSQCPVSYIRDSYFADVVPSVPQQVNNRTPSLPLYVGTNPRNSMSVSPNPGQ